MPVIRYHAEMAWLGGSAPERDVLIEIRDGRFRTVRPGAPPSDTIRLPGLTLPGFANAHSHAFHRALRGHTHAGAGTFWTWRSAMYALAARLDPDTYFRLARAVYAEMVLAGFTAVGEFHYLHHTPSGRPYADPNAMGHALLTAAAEAGIRITLLDALYLESTVDTDATAPVLPRFRDADPDTWLRRVDDLGPCPGARIGLAVHSVRSVPAAVLPAVADAIDGRPLHTHLSEQRVENDACRAANGCSPTELLDSAGLLGPGTTVVHATHLSDVDRALLGDTGTVACLCPTTERDLGDGLGPARPLADAGTPLCLGSDSHAVVDPFEEARALELDERLRTERRGHFPVRELLTAAGIAGHRAIGWTDAGVIAPGARADLVTVDLSGVRAAGAPPLPAAVFTAGAADVTHVVVDGRLVVRDRAHAWLDVNRELREAIAAVSPA